MGETETDSMKRYITNYTPDDTVSNNRTPKKMCCRGECRAVQRWIHFWDFLRNSRKTTSVKMTKYYMDQASKYIMLPRTICKVLCFAKKKTKQKKETLRFIKPFAGAYWSCWRRLGIVAMRLRPRFTTLRFKLFAAICIFVISWFGLENK